MTYNWCVFCGDKIPADCMACDECRPLVKKLDRKRRRTFEREEKKLADLAELWAAVYRLKKENDRLRKKAVEVLRKYAEGQRKEKKQ